jgi:hypothetical protein
MLDSTFSTPEARKRHEREKELRIIRERLSNYMSRRLAINKHNRDVRKLQKEREEAGLPWPPPPAPPPDKKSRKKREETPKPRPKGERARSAGKERTHFEHAPYDWMGQTWRAHERVEGWRKAALSRIPKAEAAASEASAAAIAARTDLASVYNDKGEAALRTATEAAIKAEAALEAEKTYAARFSSVDRMRATLKAQGMVAMEAAHAIQSRKMSVQTLKNNAWSIFSRASDLRREATNANLTTLERDWSIIAVVARSLADSAGEANPEDTNKELELLGQARNIIEQTSGDNDVAATQVKKLVLEAQTLAIKVIASTKTKAGLRRTKKHTRKHTRKYTKKHTKKHKKKNGKNTHHRTKH